MGAQAINSAIISTTAGEMGDFQLLSKNFPYNHILTDGNDRRLVVDQYNLDSTFLQISNLEKVTNLASASDAGVYIQQATGHKGQVVERRSEASEETSLFVYKGKTTIEFKYKGRSILACEYQYDNMEGKIIFGVKFADGSVLNGIKNKNISWAEIDAVGSITEKIK